MKKRKLRKRLASMRDRVANLEDKLENRSPTGSISLAQTPMIIFMDILEESYFRVFNFPGRRKQVSTAEQDLRADLYARQRDREQRKEQEQREAAQRADMTA